MRKYLDRQLKIRDKNLKYDFLPSMVEIIERPPSTLANVILFLIVALLGTTILWAAVCKIDITVTAMGSAMPEGGVLTLDSSTGGRVAEINVEDGSVVKKGDVILTLDGTSAQLEIAGCQYNLEVLNIQKEMYTKFYEVLCAENETDDMNSLKSTDTAAYGEHASLADAVLLEYDVYVAQLNALDNNEDKKKYRQEQTLNVLQNINNLDVKINSENTNLQNAQKTLDNLKITAPADGRITQMSVHTTGILLAQGDTAGYLLPEEKENIFTAYVADEDIGQIKETDTVQVKITAYDDTPYEYMPGTVTSVGEIAMNLDGIGTAYPVEIRMEKLPDDIRAGMEGTCNIIIGRRTVLDYFLEPFREGLSDSLKER